jgi:hypothetical protein
MSGPRRSRSGWCQTASPARSVLPPARTGRHRASGRWRGLPQEAQRPRTHEETARDRGLDVPALLGQQVLREHALGSKHTSRDARPPSRSLWVSRLISLALDQPATASVECRHNDLCSRLVHREGGGHVSVARLSWSRTSWLASISRHARIWLIAVRSCSARIAAEAETVCGSPTPSSARRSGQRHDHRAACPPAPRQLAGAARKPQISHGQGEHRLRQPCRCTGGKSHPETALRAGPARPHADSMANATKGERRSVLPGQPAPATQVPALADPGQRRLLRRGNRIRIVPLTLGGAMGIRIPDLLDAMKHQQVP